MITLSTESKAAISKQAKAWGWSEADTANYFVKCAVGRLAALDKDRAKAAKKGRPGDAKKAKAKPGKAKTSGASAKRPTPPKNAKKQAKPRGVSKARASGVRVAAEAPSGKSRHQRYREAKKAKAAQVAPAAEAAE